MKKRILAITVALAAAAAVSYAQSTSQTAAMESGIIPRDPAVLALAGVEALAEHSAWAAPGNVASTAFSQHSFDAALSTQIWNPDGTASQLYNAGLACNLKDKWGFAAAVSMDRGEAYQVYDANGRSLGDYTPSDLEAAFGASWRFLDFLSAGVGVKYMKSSLSSDYTLSAVAFDAMLNAVFGGLNASAGIVNAGGGADGYDLPSSVRAAAAYTAALSEKHAVKAGAQLDYYLVGGLNLGLGAQYCYADFVSVRAGYNLSSDGLLPSYASVGLGLKYAGFGLDAAYLLSGPLSGTISAGLRYSF